MEKENNKSNKPLKSGLNDFLGEENKESNLDCSSGVCVIKKDKGIVEVINKKIIIEDGRQLLI